MPHQLTNGAGYRVRIVASSPYFIGMDNGVNIVVNKPNAGADKVVNKCIGSVVDLTALY